MLTTAGLNDIRRFIKGNIYKAQYQVSGTWRDASIVEVIITSDNIVRVKTQIAPGEACTIQAVRLINQNQEVFCTKTVTVVLETSTTNLMQWFDFNVTEQET